MTGRWSIARRGSLLLQIQPRPLRRRSIAVHPAMFHFAADLTFRPVMFHVSVHLTITPPVHRSLSKPPSRGRRRTRLVIVTSAGPEIRQLSSPWWSHGWREGCWPTCGTVRPFRHAAHSSRPMESGGADVTTNRAGKCRMWVGTARQQTREIQGMPRRWNSPRTRRIRNGQAVAAAQDKRGDQYGYTRT